MSGGAARSACTKETTIDDTSTPRKNPNAAFRALAVGEGGVLLHLESGEYHGINEVGCLIWNLIDGERSVADLVEAVRGEVEEPPPELADDVNRFISDMRDRDLLVA